MTKRKSIIATYILAFVMCLTLVLGVSLGATTLVAHAEEGKNMPQIISVADKNNNVVEVKGGMLNLPVGMVGEEYYAKIVAANTYDTVSVKPYAEDARGCLPDGLTFDAETNVISGKPKKAGSYDVQIYCRNEYGSTNVLGWLNVYSADQKPTIKAELSDTAYVGSMYSASVAVGGYNQSFTVTLGGNYPQGMNAYRSGANAYIQFTPTAAMAGIKYEFTLSVNNGLDVATMNCTIEVEAGYVPPELITKQNLGSSADNPYGKRALVGEPYEFWLQARGTSTEEHPLTFFAYDETTQEKVTPNEKGEYDLGNGLFLRKDGLIYSDCVLEYEGQGTGNYTQKHFHIGVSNINTIGDEQATRFVEGDCYFNIVKGYMIDSFTVSPQSTDIPRGGQRQFTANIEGFGEFDKTVTWEIWGGYPTDRNTKIDSNGLLTLGANEMCATLIVRVTFKNRIVKTECINIIDHIHSTHLVEAATKTCEADGNIEHFKCDSCGGTFSDAEAINVLTEEQVTLKAGHEYGNLTPRSSCNLFGNG